MMLHKTLDSYYKNEPVRKRGEHPDGPLWLLTPKELDELPKGTIIESLNGEECIVGQSFIHDEVRQDGYLNYGIRGWRTRNA